MVLEGFNLPYRDLDGFTCCPEKSLVNNIDHGLWVLTAARNIALIDKAKVDLVSPCTGCVSNLATVNSELHLSGKEKDKVNSILAEVGLKFKGENKLRHLVPFFHDEVGIPAIKNKIIKPFNGMRIAIHYGCHMIRPSHALKNDDPLEHKQFDNNQFLMEKEGEKFGIPILYFTELLGLAMGYKPGELGLDSHRIEAVNFLEKWERLNEELSRTTVLNKELEEGFGIAQP